MLLFLMAASAAFAPPPPEPSVLTDFTIKEVAPGSGYTQFAQDVDKSILPKSELQPGVKGEVTFRLANDAKGSITACEPVDESAMPGVTRKLCAELKKQAPLPVRYAAPGRPIATDRTMSFSWRSVAWHPPSLSPAPPAPPAPPKGWPAYWSPSGLTVSSAGQATPLFAAPKGEVGVAAVIDEKVEAPDCKVMASSGNAATDAAACAVVKTIRFSYDKPCEVCWQREVPLLVVADGPLSHIEYPRDGVGAGVARRLSINISDKSRRAILAASGGKEARFNLYVDLDRYGRVSSCQMADETNQALADAGCRMLRKDAIYKPATDVFGRTHPYRRLERLRVEP